MPNNKKTNFRLYKKSSGEYVLRTPNGAYYNVTNKSTSIDTDKGVVAIPRRDFSKINGTPARISDVDVLRDWEMELFAKFKKRNDSNELLPELTALVFIGNALSPSISEINIWSDNGNTGYYSDVSPLLGGGTLKVHNDDHYFLVYYDPKINTLYEINSLPGEAHSGKFQKIKNDFEEKIGKTVCTERLLKNEQEDRKSCGFAMICSEYLLKQGIEPRNLPNFLDSKLRDSLYKIYHEPLKCYGHKKIENIPLLPKTQRGEFDILESDEKKLSKEIQKNGSRIIKVLESIRDKCFSKQNVQRANQSTKENIETHHIALIDKNSAFYQAQEILLMHYKNRVNPQDNIEAILKSKLGDEETKKAFSEEAEIFGKPTGSHKHNSSHLKRKKPEDNQNMVSTHVSRNKGSCRGSR